MDYNETVEVAFKIIGHAGDAKSLLFQAIEHAKEKKFDTAKSDLAEASDLLLQAHRTQTELIAKEAQGKKGEYSIIMVHAQDHLMNAMLLQKLSEEFCDLYRRLD